MTTEDKPVNRDAWRRLLDGGTDAPPELTDARIRAKARQALTPRAGRWWLPASLAASMLLAIVLVLVQQQYERPRPPSVVSEADYATAPATEPADGFRDEALQRQDSHPSKAPAAAISARAVMKEGAEGEKELGNFVPSPPVVPPPMLELPAVNDSRAAQEGAADAPAVGATSAPAESAPTTPAPAPKREEDVSEIVVTGNRQRSSNVESTTPVTQVTAEDVTTQGVTSIGGLQKSSEAVRPPEEWYAEIEKLRAAGKKTQAKRELKKLEEVHPGWLEKNHPTDR